MKRLVEMLYLPVFLSSCATGQPKKQGKSHQCKYMFEIESSGTIAVGIRRANSGNLSNSLG